MSDWASNKLIIIHVYLHENKEASKNEQKTFSVNNANITGKVRSAKMSAINASSIFIALWTNILIRWLILLFHEQFIFTIKFIIWFDHSFDNPCSHNIPSKYFIHLAKTNNLAFRLNGDKPIQNLNVFTWIYTFFSWKWRKTHTKS